MNFNLERLNWKLDPLVEGESGSGKWRERPKGGYGERARGIERELEAGEQEDEKRNSKKRGDNRVKICSSRGEGSGGARKVEEGWKGAKRGEKESPGETVCYHHVFLL